MAHGEAEVLASDIVITLQRLHVAVAAWRDSCATGDTQAARKSWKHVKSELSLLQALVHTVEERCTPCTT